MSDLRIINGSSMDTFLSTWKIYLAIFLGLFATFFIAYSSLSSSSFVANPLKKGNYCWVDNNHNSKVDYSDPSEFYICDQGGFSKESMKDILLSIQLQENGLWFLLLAICVTFCRDLGYMIRLRILTLKEFSWKSCFNVVFLWEFASALTPGSVGGSGVAMFILKRQGLPLGRSTAIVIVTAILDNLFFLLLSCFLFIFISPFELFPVNSVFERGVSFIFWTGFSVLIVLTLVMLFTIFLFPSMVGKIIAFIFRLPILSRWKVSADSFHTSLFTASLVFKQARFSFWMYSFLATCISWVSRYLVINFLAEAFLNLSMKDHLFVLGKQLVLWIVMLVSPTPGSSGIAEFAFRTFFESFSKSSILILVLAVIWRLITYFPYLIIGSILFPKWIKSTSKRNV